MGEFVLNIEWPPMYPNVLPIISMDAFFNRNIETVLKSEIVRKVSSEAEQYIGMPMTYTLFEYVKKNLSALFKDYKFLKDGDNYREEKMCEQLKLTNIEGDGSSGKIKLKKEQLTKSQKRRMWGKGGIE